MSAQSIRKLIAWLSNLTPRRVAKIYGRKTNYDIYSGKSDDEYVMQKYHLALKNPMRWLTELDEASLFRLSKTINNMPFR